MTAPGPAGTPGPPTDRAWLEATIALSRRSPPSRTAFSVGALVVDADGGVLAQGYSRPHDPHDHAEEIALAGLGPGWQAPPGSTLYSSLEPCSARASRPRTCTDLILGAGIGRVVFAWREPSIFVEGRGAELLRAGGVEVVEMPELAAQVREVNRHLLARLIDRARDEQPGG
jgi:diaminohydroxyphosphoribosylaminopyrimidine deaminase/5-amino-6-(5-phosphoribosylamino)uracil reductase